MNYPVLRHFPLRQSSQSDECPFYVELEDRESEDAEVRLSLVVLGR